MIEMHLPAGTLSWHCAVPADPARVEKIVTPQCEVALRVRYEREELWWARFTAYTRKNGCIEYTLPLERAKGMVLARWLWPMRARQIAEMHNVQIHSGVPTAHIDVDEDSFKAPPGPPHYKVWCPRC